MPNEIPARPDLEPLGLSFDGVVDEFVCCATGGAAERAERLLALHPDIAGATLQTALVLGDAAAVGLRLAAEPGLARQAGGPQDWEPLLYVCHTCLATGSATRLAGLVAIAQQLCALGANPKAEYHWNWHPELPRTALWGALCAVGHLPLAQVLLEAGANPTDGVSVHIAGGGGNIAALELLQRYGVDWNGIQGGVPPLAYMLSWATDAAGPLWLLEHGADANLAWGDTPLQVAARRWDVAMVERLVECGADVSTAYPVAARYGNTAVAAWLLAHGATDELSPMDRFVAACARGDRAAAEGMRAERGMLRREHHEMLHRPAESGNVAVLETMLACGFEPGAKDKDGVTPLHRAAMGGHAEAVRVLLEFGADVSAKDGMFAATPLVWAVEGRSHAKDGGAGHVEVARRLIAAGSPLGWTSPEGAPSPERTLEGLAELRAAVDS